MLKPELASVADCDQLLALYFSVYGARYPYSLCTDRDVMAKAMQSKDILWLVIRQNQKIVASSIFEIDRPNRIGKLTGVVVHKDCRKLGYAFEMVNYGSYYLLEELKLLNSVYATTRTVSVGPQLMCLKAGFKAFGIFPNSHRLQQYETTTLLIRYASGALERRAPLLEVLAPLKSIADISMSVINQQTPEVQQPETFEVSSDSALLDFEIIDAPAYVQRKFDQDYSDPYDRFFPFHAPNVIATSTNGEVEIYAHLNKNDGYCALIALNKPIFELRGRVDSLLARLHNYGVSYVEVLIGINRTKSLQTLIDKQFLPSAIYPGMRECDGQLQDFVVVSRTMEPLNFKGMAVERQFKPYIDQYVAMWKSAHLDSIEVFDDYA